MKLRGIKNIMCFILSLGLVIGSATPAIAETTDAAQDNSKDVTPVILVTGIGSSARYLNPNTENQT